MCVCCSKPHVCEYGSEQIFVFLYSLCDQSTHLYGSYLAAASCVYTRSAAAHVPAVSLEQIVDTTGAGDSFIGSFLFQLAEKGADADSLERLTCEDLTRFLTFSGNYAARTIGKKGAVMATMEEMREIYGDGSPCYLESV